MIAPCQHRWGIVWRFMGRLRGVQFCDLCDARRHVVCAVSVASDYGVRDAVFSK